MIPMERLEIAIRPPLPKTVEKLRERYRQLKEARLVIEEEMRAIAATHHDLADVRNFSCLRCHHNWTPKKNMVSDPKQCPACHSTYWNRPRQIVRTVKPPAKGGNAWIKKTVIVPDPVEIPEQSVVISEVLAPPPPVPMSLRERLAQMASKTDDAMELVETIKEEKVEEAAIEAINGTDDCT